MLLAPVGASQWTEETALPPLTLADLPPLPTPDGAAQLTEERRGVLLVLGTVAACVGLTQSVTLTLGSDMPPAALWVILGLIYAEAATALACLAALLLGDPGVVKRTEANCFPLPPAVEVRTLPRGSRALSGGAHCHFTPLALTQLTLHPLALTHLLTGGASGARAARHPYTCPARTYSVHTCPIHTCPVHTSHAHLPPTPAGARARTPTPSHLHTFLVTALTPAGARAARRDGSLRPREHPRGRRHLLRALPGLAAARRQLF